MAKVFVDGHARQTSSSYKANAKEWRLFMSSKVSNTLSSTNRREFVSMDNEEKQQREEFNKIFKEVEQLGISQMSWKKRTEIQSQKVVALGGKSEKGHKMPIAMGRNIKRKRERLEQQKLQDELAFGLSTRKKANKRSEKATAGSWGLRASEGVFKGGVLYVKPLSSTKTNENTELSRAKGKTFRKGKRLKQKGKRRHR